MSGSPRHDYLSDLTNRLMVGLRQLPDRFRWHQLEYILHTQNPDGGFSGRQGESDLYYTSFALRSADLLADAGSEGLWHRAAGWLRQRAAAVVDVVECFSALHIKHLAERQGCQVWCQCGGEDVMRGMENVLQESLTPQGGYARSAGGDASVYHTFLAALCYQLLGRSVPGAEAAAGFVRSRQCADGGFVEVAGAQAPVGTRGGINPTAAAVAVLGMLDSLDEGLARKASEFISRMQRTDGGFGAHPGAPVSDLMSTFTALATLAETGQIRRLKLGAAARFVKYLVVPAGGFRGSRMDGKADLEYTYYGLGALGLLGFERASALAQSRSCLRLRR